MLTAKLLLNMEVLFPIMTNSSGLSGKQWKSLLVELAGFGGNMCRQGITKALAFVLFGLLLFSKSTSCH